MRSMGRTKRNNKKTKLGVYNSGLPIIMGKSFKGDKNMRTTITVEFDVEIEVNEHDDFELVDILDDYTIEEVIRDQLDTQATYDALNDELAKYED